MKIDAVIHSPLKRGMEMWEGHSVKAVGRRLRLAREALGLAQNEFCGRAGIAPNTYNNYEQGRRLPTVENARRLHAAHGLTLDWIYLGDPSGLKYSLADAIKALKQARNSID